MSALGGGAVQACTAVESPEKVDPITVRLHVFFDGTRNNQYNIALRKTVEQNPFIFSSESKQLVANTLSSFQNDLSNIAHLWKVHPDDSLNGASDNQTVLHASIYVEGAATEAGREDSTSGAGLGMGRTGIQRRVADAFFTSAEKTASLLSNGATGRPLKVIFTVWGFSRGAAAARHFVHRLFDFGESVFIQPLVDGTPVAIPMLFGAYLKYQFDLAPVSVTLEFAGLFDTVASHGLIHENDSTDLHLDSVWRANKVIHLVAAQEFRKNFVLTNIKKATKGGDTIASGVEIFLPGAHSDVGGGYRESVDESQVVLKLPREWGLAAEEAAAGVGAAVLPHLSPLLDLVAANRGGRQRQIWKQRIDRDKKWFEDHGWLGLGCKCCEWDGERVPNEVRLVRRGLRNDYAFIPLHIMHMLATKTSQGLLKSAAGVLPVPGNDLRNLSSSATSGIPEIVNAESTLQQYALDVYDQKRVSSLQDWAQPKPWLRALHHKYFHMSAHYEGRELGFIYPHEPVFALSPAQPKEYGTDAKHCMEGVRSRGVLDG